MNFIVKLTLAQGVEYGRREVYLSFAIDRRYYNWVWDIVFVTF